jgi:hypothetical protein
MDCAVRSLLACTIFAGAAAPAGAQIITTTFTGVVGAVGSPAPNVDTLGLFGTKGADLTGQTMKITLKFDASVLMEGGQSPGYSAWSGPSGSCAVSVAGRKAKPSVEKLTKIDTSRVYFYSNYNGDWGLAQYAETTITPSGCGVTANSTVNAFVPSVNLVQRFHYAPTLAEQPNDVIYMNITVKGVRETVNASTTSLKYGP